MKDQIQIGDTVTVQWEHLEPITGIVLYIPCASGDAWQLKLPEEKIFGLGQRIICQRIIYVQSYSRITKTLPR